MASTLNRETLDRLLEAGADLAQAVHDNGSDHLVWLIGDELDAWENAYEAAEHELAAPRPAAGEGRS